MFRIWCYRVVYGFRICAFHRVTQFVFMTGLFGVHLFSCRLNRLGDLGVEGSGRCGFQGWGFNGSGIRVYWLRV